MRPRVSSLSVSALLLASRFRSAFGQEATQAVRFNLITVEATIKLRNLRRQPADMVIRRTLTGAVEEVSDKGVATREAL